MQKWLLTIIIAILPVITACSKTDTEVSVPEEETGKKTEIKFLQLNLWVECTKVEHAPEYLIEQIATLQPDIATFCELYKGPQDDPVMPKLMQGLKDKGLIYYDARIDGRAVISKYPIKETERINKWMFKAILDVNGKRVAVYPAHSEYRYYTCYYPRGYNDGSVNWDKLPAPITDVNKILAVCEESDRIESAQAFINNAAKELEQGALVFFAGDLNEPSYLDWQADTKDLFDHRGCIVNWGTSKLLVQRGYKDAYRVIHPDPVKCPGFTFPADNKSVIPENLSWAPEADERERIDFVYFNTTKNNNNKTMKKFSIVAALAIAISGIFASCGNTPAKANLKNDVDTLSYAIGMAQTQGLKQYLLQMDIDTTYIDEFVKGLNDGANAGDNKKKAAYYMGVQIGQQMPLKDR
jgi:hypothetical protein